MSQKRDYYEVLSLSRNASDDEIKKAYRKLARQYHPDVNKEKDAETRFKEVNEAYEVLSDPQKRAAYDRFGHAATSGAGAGGFEGGFGFNDIFESFFGNATQQSGRRSPTRGADLRYDLTLTFEEAVFGVEKELEIPRWESCQTCKGNGAQPGTSTARCTACQGTGEIRRVQQSIFGQFVNVTVCDKCRGEGRVVTTPCSTCRGSGRVKVTKKLSVTIPAGVDDGLQVRLNGEGEVGPKGGPPGNLYILLTVKAHPQFKRQGSDIIYELPLSFSQAALGDEVEIPTVDGKTSLKIPAGTQTGKTFRLREKGVPVLHSNARGDQHVVTRIVTPTNLSGRQRELLEELATLEKKDVDKSIFEKVKDVLTGH